MSIVAKERIKTNGERIFLALAPVDPRSLMQGDYMALRFEIATHISTRRQRQRRRCWWTPNGVAT